MIEEGLRDKKTVLSRNVFAREKKMRRSMEIGSKLFEKLDGDVTKQYSMIG